MNCTLYLAQKFSLLPNYDVVNQYDQTAFRVAAEFSLGRHLLIYTPQGQQVAEIKKVLLAWLNKFEVMQYGQIVGDIEQKFSLFSRKIEVNYLGWQVQGSFPFWNYEVYDASGRQIAVIDKELFHFTDHYAIHYDNPADSLNLLCLALAIDSIVDSSRNAANS